MWFNKINLTLDKILTVVNDNDGVLDILSTNLQCLVKLIDLVYTKQSSNSALIEKEGIILWHGRHLKNMRKYCEGLHLYYLSKTPVNTDDYTIKTWVDKTIKSCDTFFRVPMTGSQSPPDKRKSHYSSHRVGRQICARWLLVLQSKKPIPIIMKKLMTIHVLTGWRVKYTLIENCFIINNFHITLKTENNKLNN